MTVVWDVLTAVGMVWGAAVAAWVLFGIVELRGERKRWEELELLGGRSHCDCGCYALQYQGQELLDRVDMQVHCRDRCFPYREWVAPGR